MKRSEIHFKHLKSKNVAEKMLKWGEEIWGSEAK